MTERRVFVEQGWVHPELGRFVVADLHGDIALLQPLGAKWPDDVREVGVECLLNGDGGWKVEGGEQWQDG